MPDVLNPDIGAGSKEEPVNWYEEKADHVAGEGNTDEEHGKSLKINIYENFIKYYLYYRLLSPVLGI